MDLHPVIIVEAKVAHKFSSNMKLVIFLFAMLSTFFLLSLVVNATEKKEKKQSQVINSSQLTESKLRGLVMEDIDPF